VKGIPLHTTPSEGDTPSYNPIKWREIPHS